MSFVLRDEQFYLARKSGNLRLRAVLISSIRRFFEKHLFLEVETPLCIPAPAPEEHIEAIPSEDWFLQTSPELYMKRLMAAGYPRIFQICKCFRANERGNRHLPEFTMLEWYVAQFDYHQLMDQCETLLIDAFQSAKQMQSIAQLPSEIHFCSPWHRITVADAFMQYAPVSLEEALEKNRFDEILVEYVEPHLGKDRPLFLYDYPGSMAALAKLKEDRPDIAERFELYIGGIEIANGFSELTDPVSQRRRFEEALAFRAGENRAKYPMPEPFLAALENLPPCAGIALGIDRLIMILTGTSTIDDVVAFPPEWL